MSVTKNRSGNALPVHLGLEPFSVFAYSELAAHPLFEPGVCANPCCSKPFVPKRAWQEYCSAECRQKDDQEFRAFGLKVSRALLAHRMGKHPGENQSLRNLARAGRRYYSEAQTALLNSRLERIKAARSFDE